MTKCIVKGCFHEVVMGKCYCCEWESAKKCVYQERLAYKEGRPTYYLTEAGRLIDRFMQEMPAHHTQKKKQLEAVKLMIYAWCEGAKK